MRLFVQGALAQSALRSGGADPTARAVVHIHKSRFRVKEAFEHIAAEERVYGLELMMIAEPEERESEGGNGRRELKRREEKGSRTTWGTAICLSSAWLRAPREG